VGPDHRDRVEIETPDPVEVWAGRDLVEREVLGKEQVAQAVDGLEAGLGQVLPEGSALPGQELRPVERAEADVAEPTRAGEQHAPVTELDPDALAHRSV